MAISGTGQCLGWQYLLFALISAVDKLRALRQAL